MIGGQTPSGPYFYSSATYPKDHRSLTSWLIRWSSPAWQRRNSKKRTKAIAVRNTWEAPWGQGPCTLLTVKYLRREVLKMYLIHGGQGKSAVLPPRQKSKNVLPVWSTQWWGKELWSYFPFSNEETRILRLSNLPKVILLENHNQTLPSCHEDLLGMWCDESQSRIPLTYLPISTHLLALPYEIPSLIISLVTKMCPRLNLLCKWISACITYHCLRMLCFRPFQTNGELPFIKDDA